MRRGRRSASLVLLLGVALLIPLAGCAGIGEAIEQADLRRSIRKVGYTAEPHGNMVLAAFYELALAAGLDPRKVRIGFDDAPHPRAGAVGDHHFIVTMAVLDSRNDCLIRGIAAHELAHDVLGHADRRVMASTGIGILATAAGFVFPVAGYLLQGAGWVGMRVYTRSQETDADTLAAELLEKAGTPPWTLRYALEFLLEVYGDAGGSWDTHPDSAERVRAQPPVDPDEAETMCGPAELRAAQIGLLRRGLARAAGRSGR